MELLLKLKIGRSTDGRTSGLKSEHGTTAQFDYGLQTQPSIASLQYLPLLLLLSGGRLRQLELSVYDQTH